MRQLSGKKHLPPRLKNRVQTPAPKQWEKIVSQKLSSDFHIDHSHTHTQTNVKRFVKGGIFKDNYFLLAAMLGTNPLRSWLWGVLGWTPETSALPVNWEVKGTDGPVPSSLLRGASWGGLLWTGPLELAVTLLPLAFSVEITGVCVLHCPSPAALSTLFYQDNSVERWSWLHLDLVLTTLEVEAGELKVQSKLGVQGEFKASKVHFVRPCFEIKSKKKAEHAPSTNVLVMLLWGSQFGPQYCQKGKTLNSGKD